MPEKSYKKKHMTSFQLIIMGFAGVILLGTVLLMLPFSSGRRKMVGQASRVCSYERLQSEMSFL